MSALLNHDLCEQAWTVLLPSIKKAAVIGLTNKIAGAMVVLDPTLHYAPSISAEGAAIFIKHVNFDYQRGVLPESEEQYREIALAKALVSWRTGMPSREVQQRAPHLYQEPRNEFQKGDVKWGGSVVRDGLVVAFSSVQAVFDEWIAGMMADLLIAMCRHQMTRPGGYMEAESSFIDAGRPQLLPFAVS